MRSRKIGALSFSVLFQLDDLTLLIFVSTADHYIHSYFLSATRSSSIWVCRIGSFGPCLWRWWPYLLLSRSPPPTCPFRKTVRAALASWQPVLAPSTVTAARSTAGVATRRSTVWMAARPATACAVRSIWGWEVAAVRVVAAPPRRPLARSCTSRRL